MVVDLGTGALFVLSGGAIGFAVMSLMGKNRISAVLSATNKQIVSRQKNIKKAIKMRRISTTHKANPNNVKENDMKITIKSFDKKH